MRGPPSPGRRRSRDRVSAPNGPYDPVAAAESFGPPTSSFALPFIPEGALLRELMNPGKGRKRGVGGRTSACPGSLRRPRPRRWWETSPPRRSSCSAVSDLGGGGFQCVRLVLIDVSSHPSHPVPSCSRLLLTVLVLVLFLTVCPPRGRRRGVSVSCFREVQGTGKSRMGMVDGGVVVSTFSRFGFSRTEERFKCLS